ncbi:hypothetical protein LASUN_13410 [Lentilactobacillus sunkii]|uniref:Uncharacterized protein n=2 Tax=Lentilactobacillus sunkii TaxID=481719 RepID=A0A1E7XCN7_9LACO|nr:hypothetical protein LASUN_13410 [Lentilactobacillus sunkii]
MITFTFSGIVFYSFALVIGGIVFSNPKKYFDGGLSKGDLKNGIKKYFQQVKADIKEIQGK